MNNREHREKNLDRVTIKIVVPLRNEINEH